MAKVLSKNNAIWRFSVHAGKNKGPNRQAYSPGGMLHFFKKFKSKEKYFVITHLESGKILMADTVDIADYYLKTIIARTGLYNDR